MLPNHTWSPEFKDVCDRIAKDGIAAPFAEAEAVVAECLNLLDGQNCAELQEAQDAIKRYADALRKGDANIVLIDDNGMVTRACCDSGCGFGSSSNGFNNNCNRQCIKFKGSKAFCNLFAQDLQVPGSGFIANLTTNTFRVTGNANISGDLTVDGTIFTDETLTFEDIVVDDLTVNGTFTANGPSNIGTNAVANPINIGTAGTGRAVVIGNAAGATSVTLLSGTGDITLQSTDDLVLNSTDDTLVNATGDVQIDATALVEINASAGPINIGNDPVAAAINIGTAGARPITIGNTTALTTTTLVGASTLANGIALNAGGFVSVQAPAQVTGATPLVLNSRVGQVNYTGLTTAAGGTTAAQVLTNSAITATSIIIFSTNITGAEDAQMAIKQVTLGAGTASITFRNNGAAALASNIQLKFWVLN
jgi:hypothetical protein